jgi:SAM-dependent methyltransferase
VVDRDSSGRFKLQCPICQSAVEVNRNTGLCQLSKHRFKCAEGIWRFLPLAREVEFREFLNIYNTVRAREGWGACTPEYYRSLPRVPNHDPQHGIWHIRERSFRRLLELIGKTTCLKILDVGAGNAWLSNQLARHGHTVAALDLSDDVRDGLGARMHYLTSFECYQAEFDCLPFCEGQFDLTIFGASLHYSAAPEVTLREAKRVLADGGKIIVMDSPFYSNETSGLAMIATREADFAREFGFKRQAMNTGFFTEATLQRAAANAGLEPNVWHTDNDRRRRWRRAWTQWRTGRESARFPLIILET